MSAGPPAPDPPAERPDRDFRWQALFQRTDDPLFILNRRRTLLSVNRAWEKLTGLSASEARHLVCRRRRPVTLADTPQDILAYLLCPPQEALRGETVQVRRLLPGGSPPRWWDVEFTPLREKGRLRLLGRIVPVQGSHHAPRDETITRSVMATMPPRLAALRQQVQRRLNLFLPSEAVPTLRRLAEQVRLAAELRCPVVLLGEPGSGKQTLARLIHAHSPQRERSFAALDCAAPAGLVGRGAAAGRRRGLAAPATGRTLSARTRPAAARPAAASVGTNSHKPGAPATGQPRRWRFGLV